MPLTRQIKPEFKLNFLVFKHFAPHTLHRTTDAVSAGIQSLYAVGWMRVLRWEPENETHGLYKLGSCAESDPVGFSPKRQKAADWFFPARGLPGTLKMVRRDAQMKSGNQRFM